MQRVAAAADFGNGISGLDVMNDLLFINPDLTIHLHRLPVGEWVCLDARAATSPTASASQSATCTTRPDPIGRSIQSLLLDSPLTLMHVVATAGHVDHGKSTLVLALTGIDPDRFTEEKRRGLTIDLGFAWTTLPSGNGVAFVDVPGHVRFLKNMLAGVGARRRVPVRRRRHRRLEAAVRGTPAHPRAARRVATV